MAKTLEGKYYINGKDAYLEYGLVFEKGAFDSLLMFPETKEGYSEEYQDQTGTDYMAYPDTVVNTLSIDVPFLLLADNRTDFLTKYNKLRDFLLPGKYFVIEVPTLAMGFQLRYSKMTTFKKVTQLKDLDKVAAKLTMTLIDDTPDSRSVFKTAFAAAKIAGYTIDEAMFQNAVSADLPYSYQKEAEIILAPGISKIGMIAGVNRYGGLVEFSFSRSGVATYVGKDGLLKTAVADEPRVDYSYGIERLLIEAASTNLIKYSRALSSGYWIKSGLTAVDNATIGRDGGLNAAQIDETTGTSSGLYNTDSIPVTEAQSYTLSFWAKKGTKLSGYNLFVYDAASPGVTIVDYTDYSDLLNNDKFSKVEVTFSIPTGTTGIRVFLIRDAASQSGGNFFITDVQLEQAVGSTSTIITNGSTVTRVGDTVNSVSANLVTSPANSVLMNYTGSGLSGTWVLYKSTNARFISDGGSQKWAVDDTTSSVNAYNLKTLTVFDTSGKTIFNGGVKGTSTAVILAAFNQSARLKFAYKSTGTSVFIRTMAFFSRRFSDAESISITK